MQFMSFWFIVLIYLFPGVVLAQLDFDFFTDDDNSPTTETRTTKEEKADKDSGTDTDNEKPKLADEKIPSVLELPGGNAIAPSWTIDSPRPTPEAPAPARKVDDLSSGKDLSTKREQSGREPAGRSRRVEKRSVSKGRVPRWSSGNKDATGRLAADRQASEQPAEKALPNESFELDEDFMPDGDLYVSEKPFDERVVDQSESPLPDSETEPQSAEVQAVNITELPPAENLVLPPGNPFLIDDENADQASDFFSTTALDSLATDVPELEDVADTALTAAFASEALSDLETAPDAGQFIRVSSTVWKVKKESNAVTGAVVEELVGTGSLASGDTVLFSIDCWNEAEPIKEQVVITYPVPEVATWLQDTVTGPGTSHFYSADGGYSFSTFDRLQIRKNGRIWPAKASDVTHIRWVYEPPFRPGRANTLTFQGKIK